MRKGEKDKWVTMGNERGIVDDPDDVESLGKFIHR